MSYEDLQTNTEETLMNCQVKMCKLSLVSELVQPTDPLLKLTKKKAANISCIYLFWVVIYQKDNNVFSPETH